MLTPFTLTAADGAAVAAYRATPDGPARGAVQIAHGMAEHVGRYAELADRLGASGYAVYAADHRGHGASAAVHGQGEFGSGGFQTVVDDMWALTQVARAGTPGVPLVLLGHSMGSFAAQLYLLDHSAALAGLVLSGTAALDKTLEAMLAAGGHIGLEALNVGFEPARTPFDWLSRDETQVDAYIADPICGFDLAEASLASVFLLGSSARTDPRLVKVRRDLPIYVISGEFDPVTGPGQAFANALIDSWRAEGLTAIEHRVWPGGRHEMFNETCRGQVVDELIAWLDKTVAAARPAP